MANVNNYLPAEDAKPFQYYPFNSVVGFIPTEQAANGALDALHALSYTEDEIGVLHGEAGVRYLDASGEHHGVVGRVGRLLQNISDVETFLLKRSEAELLQGNYLFRIITNGDRDAMLKVRDVLKQFDGYFITFYHAVGTEITN